MSDLPPLPEYVTEDLDTNLLMIQSVLRIARNDAGHPSGAAIPSREQVYTNLQSVGTLCAPAHEIARRFEIAVAKRVVPQLQEALGLNALRHEPPPFRAVVPSFSLANSIETVSRIKKHTS